MDVMLGYIHIVLVLLFSFGLACYFTVQGLPVGKTLCQNGLGVPSPMPTQGCVCKCV